MGRTNYSTRDEAIEREIVEPIEVSGIVGEAWSEYDIEAIARDVLVQGVTDTGRYYWTDGVDPETFWQSVARHARHETY